jgi:hypothetical protein
MCVLCVRNVFLFGTALRMCTMLAVTLGKCMLSVSEYVEKMFLFVENVHNVSRNS